MTTGAVGIGVTTHGHFNLMPSILDSLINNQPVTNTRLANNLAAKQMRMGIAPDVQKTIPGISAWEVVLDALKQDATNIGQGIKSGVDNLGTAMRLPPGSPPEAYDAVTNAAMATMGLGYGPAVGRMAMGARPSPSTLNIFAGGVPKGSVGGVPASKETLDILNKKYPNSAARNEKYLVSEFPSTKGSNVFDTKSVNVQVFPESTPAIVPRRFDSQSSPEHLMYNPEMARVKKNVLVDEDSGIDLSSNFIEAKNKSLSLPNKSSEKVMYRGMSFEEFNEAMKKGFFKSKGDFNIQGQENLTYWSSRPSQAQNYASDFAPSEFKATFDRPAYVVGVKRKKVDRIDADTELGVRGETPIKDVVEIYKGDVHSMSPAHLKIYDDLGQTKISGSNMSSNITWSKYKPTTK